MTTKWYKNADIEFVE